MGARLGAIALLAMLVRAVVPAGYMLAEAETAQGRYLTVQLCEGHSRGSVARVIDLDTGKQVNAPETGKTGGKDRPAPCVFAAAPAAAMPVAIAEPAGFAASYDIDFAVVSDARPGRGMSAPPPPSTGPPTSI